MLDGSRRHRRRPVDGGTMTRLAELPSLRVVARATPGRSCGSSTRARRADRTVAVTGDGVNDAPALQRPTSPWRWGAARRSPGRRPTSSWATTRSPASMDGLREGRRIVANVQKGLVFLASTHVALLGFILIATIAGFRQPLLPIQILWLELFIDLSTPSRSSASRRSPAPCGGRRGRRGGPLLDRGILIGVAHGRWVHRRCRARHSSLGAGADGPRPVVGLHRLGVGQVVRAYANRSLTVPVHRLPTNGFLAIAAVVGDRRAGGDPYHPTAGRCVPGHAVDAA